MRKAGGLFLNTAPVQLELTRDYFPSKAYGDLVFPCGVYDAARITIGSGKGRNWWCVLYPSLCFVDSVHAVVPASSRRTLASQMSEADYHALLPRDAPQHAREDTSQNKKPEIQIKSRLLELISGCGS